MRASVVGASCAIFLVAGTAGAGAATIDSETETTPFPGITIRERRTSGPKENIWAADVALCTPGVRVDARSSQTSRITAAAWGAAMGAKLATNGDFYRTDRTTPTVYGDAVGVGMRWPTARTGRGDDYAGDWYHERYGWIAFGDGWVELNHTGYVKQHAAELGVTLGPSPSRFTTEIPPGTRALVSGFPELVVEGKVVSEFPDRGDCANRNPRTAMGLTRDRSKFMLVVVDGRSDASVGMTCAEMATLMGDLGAFTAINLDGGGSTQMWLDGEGTLNDPSDGAPRAVANHWGVFAGDDAPAAHCFQAGGCFPSPIPEAAGARFADLPDDAPGQAAAATLVDRDLLSPCATDERPMFCPSCPMSRRDAAALIARAAAVDGLATPPASASFVDVPADDPSFAAIEAAHAAGWIDGCATAGGFCPDDTVTRETFAAWLAAARGEDALACAPGETGPIPRLEAATLAVDAFDLDGDGSCDASEGGGGGGPDDRGDGPAMMGSGCSAAGRATSGGAWAMFALALALVTRRRR